MTDITPERLRKLALFQDFIMEDPLDEDEAERAADTAAALRAAAATLAAREALLERAVRELRDPPRELVDFSRRDDLAAEIDAALKTETDDG